MKNRTLSLLLTVALIITMMPQGIVTAKATENSAVTVCVESVSAQPGETVNVNVSIANNPGLLGAGFTVSYDSGITLINAEAGDAFSALVQTKPGNFASPCNFMWDAQEIKPDAIKDGVFLTLAFQVSEETKTGDAFEVRITPMTGNNIDVDFRPVQIDTTSGTISVVSYIPGDLSGDGTVNTIDVILLRRYIAGGYDVNINVEAADVNGDGSINTIDIILIRRFIAGGYTNSDGSPLALKPGLKKCDHSFEAIAAKKATCTEDGNIAYWHCTKCGKNFSDAAGTAMISLENTVIKGEHTIVVDPAVPATATTHGLTEGSHCSVCGKVFVAQQKVPYLVGDEHAIIYDIANGDPYLEKLLTEGKISNNNPIIFDEKKGISSLGTISVPGYRFLGWYDLPEGSNAISIKKIEPGTNYDVELFAHWTKIEYKAQFKSDLFLDTNEAKYTVDEGLVLPTPKLSNYVFTGWSDENGKLYKDTIIPAGTTGNITLVANWTSERNKTWTKTKLDAPVIVEDDNTILFLYEIGEIRNVPISTIKNFGYISEGGIERAEDVTYTTQAEELYMEAFAESAAKATVESSDWTLSENWNEVTTVDEGWCEKHGITKEEAEIIGRSSTNNWNISSGTSGSTDTTTLTTDQAGLKNQAKITGSASHTGSQGGSNTDGWDKSVGINGNIGHTPGTKNGGFGWGIGLNFSNGENHQQESHWESSNTTSSGFEAGGEIDASKLVTNSTVQNSGWNSSSSYGGSSTNSSTYSNTTAISDEIAKTYNYGKSYMTGGGSSSTRGVSSTLSSEEEYTSSVTYSKLQSETLTSTWNTKSTKAGYHRWIIVGTAHVFGVVGYDISTRSYFVYTFSVMDEKTEQFEDYSYIDDTYHDYENGVIPFEVPYDIAEYVSERTSYSAGLKVDQNTGTITGYTGTENCVVIPEYMNVGNGRVVKITGISQTAFKNNTNIEVVVLSDFITVIPNNAFQGCTSLLAVRGGSVNKIGNNAFKGCIAIEEIGVDATILELGTNAFEGVDTVYISAANAGVAENAVSCGAKKIVLFAHNLDDGSGELLGMSFNVPEGTEYFEFNGVQKNKPNDPQPTYNDLTIISNAEKTVINKAYFVGSGRIPLQLSSSKVVLNDVSVSSSGITVVLSADYTDLGLQGTIRVGSDNTNALLCKNVWLYESNEQVVGWLAVDGKILVCGDIYSKDAQFTYGAYERIDDETFEKMLHSYTLYFNADGGTCGVTSKEVSNGTAIGEMPTPTKDYNQFDGWFLEDGTPVTPNTVFSTGNNVTVFAHWTQNGVSDWVPITSMPSDAQVVNTKWKYDLTSYTTSSSPTLSGWTQYNSTWVWGSYGNWSSWSDSQYYDSDSRQIETRSVEASYNLISYTCGRSDGYRCYLKYPQSGYTVRYGPNYVTVTADYLNALPQVAQGGWWDGNGNSSFWGYVIGPGTGYIYDWCVPYFIESINYKTQWRYRDRSKVYTYYFSKVEAKESTVYPSSDNISNIVEWVQYRSI